MPSSLETLAAPGRRAVLVLIASLSLGLLAACSGGEEDPTGTPEGSADSFRVATLNDLTGYRYEVAVSLLPEGLATQGDIPAGLLQPGAMFELQVSGAFVTPDREHSVSSFSLGDLSLHMESIRVGDRMWSREGEGAWRESAAAGGGNPLLGDLDYRPSAIFAVDASYSLDDLTARLGELPHVVETVNGVEARRYTMTPDQFERVFQSDQAVLPAEAGAEATFIADIWIAEVTGTPTRLVIVGTNAGGAEILSMTMDIRDANESIVIEPPA